MKRLQEATFREYVTARMDPLRRTAYLLCRDWHTADDLVSVTIGKLYRHWHRAEQMVDLDGYVRRILVHAWLDETRRPWRREHPTDELPERPAAAWTTADPALLAERADVLELLSSLPKHRQAVIVLRLYCDLSVAETAEILGCSTGAVKSQTARGLDALRVLLTVPANG